MGFFKKLAKTVNSVDIDSITKKVDEALISAQSKMDEALNTLDKKLDGDNETEVKDVRPAYSINDMFVVPEGITEIDEETFEDYNDESVIVLPSTLEEIDSESFGYIKVKYIDFSKVTKLTTIPDYLFSSLKKITEIRIPEGVKEIGSDVFAGCDKLRKVVLPSTLESVEDGTFSECENIECLDMSKVKKLTTIPDYLFSSLKKITEIRIPEGVKEIGSDVFDNCDKLRKIVLPSTLESIEGGIDDCTSLQEIVFTEGIKIKSLPEYFLPEDYKGRSFTIPYGVETVEEPICSQGNLTELYIPATAKEIGAITENSENETDVYLYACDIDDIENLSADTKTLYVMPEAYNHYQELIDNLDDPDDNNVELKVMPLDKRSFYDEPKPSVRQQPAEQPQPIVPPMPVIPPMPEESTPAQVVVPPMPSSIPTETVVPPMPTPTPQEAPTVETPKVVKRPGQLFSDGLEELINAAVISGEITDKKREIILRRAIKEGEDPDEVEMVLDARLYEAKNK